MTLPYRHSNIYRVKSTDPLLFEICLATRSGKAKASSGPTRVTLRLDGKSWLTDQSWCLKFPKTSQLFLFGHILHKNEQHMYRSKLRTCGFIMIYISLEVGASPTSSKRRAFCITSLNNGLKGTTKAQSYTKFTKAKAAKAGKKFRDFRFRTFSC